MYAGADVRAMRLVALGTMFLTVSSIVPGNPTVKPPSLYAADYVRGRVPRMWISCRFIHTLRTRDGMYVLRATYRR